MNRDAVIKIIEDHKALFLDTPRTNLIVHDEVTYNVLPMKRASIQTVSEKRDDTKRGRMHVEKYSIEPSKSPWTSPCVLVPKPGGYIFRFCTDYQKVSAIMKSDSNPIPRIDDRTHRVEMVSM